MPISKQLAIRFARSGCTNRPFYHLVVMLKHKGCNKEYIEQLGSYDMMPNTNNERLIAINFDRLKYWMARDAEPTKPVLKILGLSGFLPIHPMTYIDAKRRRADAASAAAAAQEAEQATTQEASSS